MKKEGLSEEVLVKARNERLLKRKYYLDKIGYGFSSTQFINILFSFTGASIFLIGFINGFKSFLATFVSTFIKEIVSKREVSKKIISVSGLVFGFSFLLLALSVVLSSVFLFAFSLLLGGVSVAFYGELFNNFLNKYSKRGKLDRVSPFSTIKGLLLSSLSIVLAAGIIDLSLMNGSLSFKLFGDFLLENFYGYLLVFEITAFAFIASSYLFAKVKLNQDSLVLAIDYGAYCKELISKAKNFFKNKYLFVLTISMLFVSVFQSLINAFMGIYVFNHLKSYWFGGFLNVGVMYAVALLFAFLGPFLVNKVNRSVGVVPMFVFGALLMALLPLTVVFNPYFYPAIVFANALSVLGAALIGSSQGVMASKVLSVEDRKSFYSSGSFLSLGPFIVLVSFFSYLAHITNLSFLFKVLGIGLIVVVVPLYFLIVFWELENKRVS